MALGFGGNSRYLVTGGTAQLVKIWDLKAQVLAKTLTGHTATVTAVTFNKDSTMVASGSLSGEVLLHNLLTALPKASAPLKSTDGQVRLARACILRSSTRIPCAGVGPYVLTAGSRWFWLLLCAGHQRDPVLAVQ